MLSDGVWGREGGRRRVNVDRAIFTVVNGLGWVLVPAASRASMHTRNGKQDASERKRQVHHGVKEERI
jgi:hypothetical protein